MKYKKNQARIVDILGCYNNNTKIATMLSAYSVLKIILTILHKLP